MEFEKAFITPMKTWEPINGISQGKNMDGAEKSTAFKGILSDLAGQVYSTQQDVEKKQYLLASGQLDDAHSLPIAEAKAELSLEVLISLRNKAMESYSELMKMSI